MKNKFIFSAVFLICIFLIPSFCYGFTYEAGNKTITVPDFNMPEGTSDYVVFASPNYGYVSFIGFKNKNVALSSYIIPSSTTHTKFALNTVGDVWTAYTSLVASGWSPWLSFSSYMEPFKWYSSNSASNFFPLSLPGSAYCGEGFGYHVLYSTFDVKDQNGNIVAEKVKDKPFIVNKEQIQTGKFDKVVINAADYTNQELYLLTYWFTENTDNPFETMLPRKIIPLKVLNEFYVGTQNEKAIYEVSFGHTGIDLVER